MQSIIQDHDLILLEAAIVEPIRRGQTVALDPLLVHGGLVYEPAGRAALGELYRQYAEIASNVQTPLLMCTPTWRTNLERVQESGVDENINQHATEFLRKLCNEQHNLIVKIGGTVGCKNDCYQPKESLSAEEAEKFHTWQVEQLAKTEIDFLLAVTLPAIDEAKGIAKAMAATQQPYVISFVINRLGKLLDGTSLVDAINQIDDWVPRVPLGYMVNCAYPTFLCAEQQPKSLFTRLIGFQGNASSLDHDQLDRAEELQTNDLAEWGNSMISLHDHHGIKILGGCCGTNRNHLQFIADHIAQNRK